jgi:hypothetical protein
MPTYRTQCGKCGVNQDTRLTFEQYDQVRNGLMVMFCSACEGAVSFVFAPGDVTFILKDGESGGWTSKAQKENKYRARHQRVMEQRMKDHAPRTQLVPNFGGELAPSWKEAREAAREVAYTETEGTSETKALAAREAAATYDPLVKQELA